MVDYSAKVAAAGGSHRHLEAPFKAQAGGGGGGAKVAWGADGASNEEERREGPQRKWDQQVPPMSKGPSDVEPRILTRPSDVELRNIDRAF